jgi:NAD(P)-dependent dehydrogenase (short-subunit alcohol dehydrogenase family)
LPRQLVATRVEVVIGARDPQAAAAAASELDGVRSYAGSLDVADPESVHRAATLWAENIGLLDILINNAAAYVDWSEMGSTADLKAAERVMQVNLFGSRCAVVSAAAGGRGCWPGRQRGPGFGVRRGIPTAD